jgi:hypothetical protein
MKSKIIPMNGEPKKVRRIDWSNPNDLKAVVIASLGFSNHCVREFCDLSDGQIGYRLKLAHSQKARKEFRDGTSPLAKQVISAHSKAAVGRVEKQIAKAHQTDSKAA